MGLPNSACRSMSEPEYNAGTSRCIENLRYGSEARLHSTQNCPNDSTGTHVLSAAADLPEALRRRRRQLRSSCSTSFKIYTMPLCLSYRSRYLSASELQLLSGLVAHARPSVVLIVLFLLL